ncbi:lipopolysaccharide biosynthesis protein [Epilithonimonas hominis]|uniref:Lipopolysaccharide biosynthesis protein n=1 Tax=Epilithonimonas hominis TaxID=420404 RepID=A0A3N0X6H3_9FLAO|nr:lipopolysaccharide biosynthesis protein [Epilithonimonas hominis]ROI12938.1 lipopolysaccharide biosynthesis protein [Epilithonimonas hominis]
MSLKQKTISNVKWSFVESMSLKAISFFLGIILARLLLPSDFGILAVVNVFYLLVTLFVDGGLKEALIQKSDVNEIHYSTVFWLNIIMSVFLYLILFIAAPFIEDFYDYENLSFFIRLQSLTLVIESVGIIQIAKATKELNLKKITKARIPTSLISFVVGIYLAYNGFGILSLIIQQLVNAFFYVVFLLISVRYVPKFIFQIREIRDLYRFGAKILLVTFLSRFYVQSLSLIFAKYYSPALLGLNNKSRSIQSVPVEIINSSFMKGLYPSMVQLKNNKTKLKDIFNLNVRLITYLMLLINGIFFFQAQEIVIVLLGKNWIDSAVYLKIFAIGSIFYPITIQAQNIFKILNKVNLYLKIELGHKVFILISVLFLVYWISFPKLLIIIVILNVFLSFFYQYLLSAELGFSIYKESFYIIKNMLIVGFGGWSIQKGFDSFFIMEPIYSIFCFSILYAALWLFLIWKMDSQLLLHVKKIFIK